ncbi:hypothetical protein EF099_15610 [Pseudomonas sp. SSM44]|nr:hypothetical protein EF099_15610 [Pseudomonas sp. SSM44]|tara:strand:+ start:4843 stop:5049 length:207 start_codon:yes stop_codon:yes gene_type:complete
MQHCIRTKGLITGRFSRPKADSGQKPLTLVIQNRYQGYRGVETFSGKLNQFVKNRVLTVARKAQFVNT